MVYLEVAIAVLLLAAYIHFQRAKRRNNYELDLINNQLHSSEELKWTLAMGLYLRFCEEEAPEDEEEDLSSYSDQFIKETPLVFEDFVADIFEKARGGQTDVLPSKQDFGVDFTHKTEDGLFLGQVKCWKEDVDFEPIALIHSNMVKKKAIGGYVITTSSFTDAAKEYAEGLDIELINGKKLVEFWIEALQSHEEEIKKVLPNLYPTEPKEG
ncbi:restriction endonuclease [Lederbergia sp. NSJ-179]|uniref:restriction endonuclease n=1 Tax=Lederbergia sp. NSJ-179 TaxID=2931402 RepID=UPI001FD56368|nr:restriction endonuclease [Lederbergia sp. NSJ-179]MCJ7842722.1 restriction endonuclease [Lederbergia sp. NSJ-179]